jgi:hypothetical protein
MTSKHQGHLVDLTNVHVDSSLFLR